MQNQASQSHSNLNQHPYFLNEKCSQVFEGQERIKERLRRQNRRATKNRCPASANAPAASPNESGPAKRPRRRVQEWHQLMMPSQCKPYIQELDSILAEHMFPTCGEYPNIDRALVHLSFAQQRYHEVHSIINQMVSTIPASWEAEIEFLWDNASYNLQRHTVNELNSVNRYRIRKRWVCPTVHRSGGKKYKLSPNVKCQLWHQFSLNPKPGKLTREALSKSTGLNMATISNWFKNRRQRAKLNGPFYERDQFKCSSSLEPSVCAQPVVYTASQEALSAPIDCQPLADCPNNNSLPLVDGQPETLEFASQPSTCEASSSPDAGYFSQTTQILETTYAIAPNPQQVLAGANHLAPIEQNYAPELENLVPFYETHNPAPAIDQHSSLRAHRLPHRLPYQGMHIKTESGLQTSQANGIFPSPLENQEWLAYDFEPPTWLDAGLCCD